MNAKRGCGVLVPPSVLLKYCNQATPREVMATIRYFRTAGSRPEDVFYERWLNHAVLAER